MKDIIIISLFKNMMILFFPLHARMLCAEFVLYGQFYWCCYLSRNTTSVLERDAKQCIRRSPLPVKGCRTWDYDHFLGRDLYRAIPAMTWDYGLHGLTWRSVPFTSRQEYWWPILPQIPTGTILFRTWRIVLDIMYSFFSFIGILSFQESKNYITLSMFCS